MSLASNPVNLYVGGRHVVVSSQNFVSQMKKRLISRPDEDPRHRIKSLTSGSALAKVFIGNMHIEPSIDRLYSDSMSLLSIPDVFLIADPSTSESVIEADIGGCKFCTLPSFDKSGHEFLFYYTGENSIELSQVD